MFATVRESTYDPETLLRGQAQQAEFAALLARQPGYAGAVGVDAGAGRLLTVTLWESEAQHAAAAAALRPDAERLHLPFRSPPFRVVAAGPVLTTDLAKR
jgi:hypothetical protein